MLILSADDVRKALPMRDAIRAVKRAYGALSAGQAHAPLRTSLEVAAYDGVSLFMPGYVQDVDGGAVGDVLGNAIGDALAVKVVSLFSRNHQHGLPLIHAAVLVLEPDTGRPTALLEGASLTAIRTGAASGAATDILARPESSVLAIFGAGVQARTQLEAVCTVRNIQTVWIYDPDKSRVDALIQEMAGSDPIPVDLRPASSPAVALTQADVICTATTSFVPVFSDADLNSGVHINGVGSYTPKMAEIPPETIQRALVVVDSRSACLAEAGDLIQPILFGLYDEGRIHAELGEILLGKLPGRTSPAQITVFKSVGLAIQDAAAAQAALKNAESLGLGQMVTF